MNADPNARDKLLNDLSSTLTPVSEPISDTPPAPPVISDHKLIRRIGRGSYGEVWLACNALGTWRAVKIVYRSAFDHNRPYEREFEGIRRFEPISRTHPSQLNVLHVGRNDSAGHFYYVMELADAVGEADGRSQMGDREKGPSPTPVSNLPFSNFHLLSPDTYSPRTLRSDLYHRGRLPFEECLDIGLALATALDHLHRNGLVHRDIKPSNIIFVNGIPKLADIGLVAQAEATLSLVGTEGYLPPEGPGTAQADIYSLGKVLYEMATGRDRQEFPELPTNLIAQPAAERAQLAELNEIIVRACHADPKQRYQTVAQLHSDLALIQSGKSVSRMRTLERRLRFVQRAGAAVTTLAAVIAAGWLWQARQTHIVRELFTEKTKLAEANRQIAEEKTHLAAEKSALAEENRNRIVRLDIANGVRLLDAKDPSAALLWFADALPLVTNVPAVADIHRIRIQQTLNVTPRLLDMVAEGGNIQASAFSPDGSRMAISALLPSGEKLTMRNARSGEVIWEQPPESKALRQVRFARDGRRLFVCSSETQGLAGHASARPAFQVAEVLDAETGKPLLPRLSSNIECSAFSPDDHWLAVAFTNHVIRLLDMSSGQFTIELQGHTNEVLMLAFNGDGSLVASGSRDGSARVWRIPSGEPVGKPMTDDRPLRRVALSADGRYLATATENSENAPITRMQVWKVETGEKLDKPMTEKGAPRTLFFGPSGPTTLFTGGETVNPRIWDIGNDVTLQRTLSFETVRCWALSPDQRMLAMGTDSRYATIWSTETWNKLFPPFRHTGYVESVSFSPDGKRLLTTSDDGSAKVWSLVMPTESARLELSTNLFVTESQDARPRGRTPGPVPTGLVDFGLHLIDPERLVEIQTLKAQPGNRDVSGWVAGRAGRFWVVGGPPPESHSTNELTLWARQDGAFSWRNLPERPEKVAVAQFNADESRLFTVTVGQKVLHVHIWRTSDGSLERSVPLPEGRQYLMPGFLSESFQPSGQALLMCWFDDQQRQQLQLFDLATSQWSGTPFPSADASGALDRSRLSPDGTRLASVGGQVGVIINLQKGQLVAPPFKHVGPLMDLDWSPDGKRLLTAGFGVKVWDALTGEMFGAPLEGDSSARWSADGRFIATRGGDWFARVWDASTTEPVTPFLPHSGYIRWVCITPGNRLITASDPNLIRAWDLKPTTLPVDIIADYAKLLSGRRLSATGVLLPIPAKELAELDRSLRARAPELFEP